MTECRARSGASPRHPVRGWEPASSTRCRQHAEGMTYPACTAKFDSFIKKKRTTEQSSGIWCRGDEHSTTVLRAPAPRGLVSANGRCRGCQKQPPALPEHAGSGDSVPQKGQLLKSRRTRAPLRNLQMCCKPSQELY